jgi:ArsR family transcriptional regulator, arsenate/arsenite/antimonite-responsive transcriptional repressor
MDERQALFCFAALAQETRLRIIRLLVKAGRDGLPAGAVAEAMGVSPSNVSFHLKELERAGMIVPRRDARQIFYAADYEGLSSIIRFLMEDCCAGRSEVCAPVLASPCCAPLQNSKPKAKASKRKERAHA